MAADPLILIPPSEGKAAGGDGPVWSRGSMRDGALDASRARLLPVARREGVTARRAPTRPAIVRYTGVLHRELDWTTLPSDARRRGAASVRIASGLWGLVAPDDPIPDYRLKMSSSLPGTGRLAAWWRPRLAPVLAALADGRVVWDLLPIEHRSACDWEGASPLRRVTIRFADSEDRTVSHWNKLLKGAVVRWLLTERPEGPEDLESFDHPAGYRLDPSSSSLRGTEGTVVMRAV